MEHTKAIFLAFLLVGMGCQSAPPTESGPALEPEPTRQETPEPEPAPAVSPTAPPENAVDEAEPVGELTPECEDECRQQYDVCFETCRPRDHGSRTKGMNREEGCRRKCQAGMDECEVSCRNNGKATSFGSDLQFPEL